MSTFSELLIRSSFTTAALMSAWMSLSHAAELQKFSDAKLVNNPANDADSFFVNIDGKVVHVRLYFVDCPGTSASSQSDARRVREQTRYFGLTNAEHTIRFGNEAKGFVERMLAKPFTVHTAFASAMGRSSGGRVYAFISTSDEADLASLLVRNGFARTQGVGRRTPDGIPRNEMVDGLRDIEVSAMLKRTGIWSGSDPERIAELRAKQRVEEKQLQEIQRQVEGAVPPQGSPDLNTATEKELQTVKGIGPVLAARITAGRPYKAVDDLLEVKGIGPKTLEKFRPYLVVGGE